MCDCTIIILTYKGIGYLKELLPSVRIAIDNSLGYVFEVVVLDNGPDDGSKTFVESFDASVRYIRSTKNDYLFSYNEVLFQLKSPFAFLCDNDTRLHPELFNEVMPILINDKRVFSVYPNVMDWNGVECTNGPRVMRYHHGWMHDFFMSNPGYLQYSLYSGGGSSILRTQIFKELGGFDTLFRPAYCEDKDLGHRAWKMGYTIVFAPKAIMYHRSGGTFNQDQSKKNEYEQMICLNNLKWILKNVDIPWFLFWFFLLYPYRLVVSAVRNRNLFYAMLSLFRFLPVILKKRKQLSNYRITDKEIISKLNLEYTL